MRGNKSKNQLLFLFLAVGFLIGIIYENVITARSIIPAELFSTSNLQAYLKVDIITEKYLWYVAKERILLLALLCVLSCLPWKKLFVSASLLICGFLTGVLTVSAVLQLGIKGILLCFIGILPQGIFYGMAYGMLFTYWFHFPERKWNRVKTIFVILMFMAGIMVETYVNPFLIKLFIRMI